MSPRSGIFGGASVTSAGAEVLVATGAVDTGELHAASARHATAAKTLLRMSTND